MSDGLTWRVVAGACVGGAVLFLAGLAAGAGTAAQPAKATVTVTAQPAEATQPSQQPDIPGDGTFVVGAQVKPGTYVASGFSGDCYWARLSDVTGGPDSIIANEVTKGQALVTIQAGDVAFKTTGCGGWVGSR